MDSKYLFVNIRVPLEIKDGSYDVIAERMVLDIEPCAKLPPINTSENDRILFEQIYLIQISNKEKKEKEEVSKNEKKEEEKEEVSKNEKKEEEKEEEEEEEEEEKEPVFVFNTNIAQGKTRKNISIRNRSNKSSHYTRKNYESDLNSDSDVDSVPRLTILEES